MWTSTTENHYHRDVKVINKERVLNLLRVIPEEGVVAIDAWVGLYVVFIV